MQTVQRFEKNEARKDYVVVNKGQFTKSKVYGVGVDDTNYQKERRKYSGNTSRIVWYCKTYSVWRNMLRRCYAEGNPAYVDVIVCEEWLKFSGFKGWYEKNLEMFGYDCQLDKDIKVFGNRVYSPETCALIPRELNTFIVYTKSNRKGLIGCWYDEGRDNYQAYCKLFMGSRKSLGRFPTELKANLAWQKEKMRQLQLCFFVV